MASGLKIASYRPPTNATRASKLSDRFDDPDAEPLGLRRVLTQALHDLYGTKDVQDAITASYVWMADQIGHVTLGLVPTLLLCWIWRGIWACWIGPGGAPSGVVWYAGLAVVTVLPFCYWLYKEIIDFHDTQQRAGKVFTFDADDIVWNVKTALLYFGIGGLFAVASFVSGCALVIVVLLTLWPAFRVAFWWLRRKLAFQQAGLPYLYRLANFTVAIDHPTMLLVADLANLRQRTVRFWKVCFGSDPIRINDPRPIRHILLTGDLGAGKTSLAVGIGTEFAFALGIGRYLTAAKLVQIAADADHVPPRMDYDDGRILWPWKQCDLLIIDDVDAGVKTASGATAELIQPADLEKALSDIGAAPLTWLGQRRSVWVLGNAAAAPAWKEAIAGLLGIGTSEITIIDLKRGAAGA
jgi:hypothetical protein